VTFYSNSSNLVPDDTNGIWADVFVKDTQNGLITLVSRDSFGQVGEGTSARPKISNDGRYVIFSSTAPNLVTGDTNKVEDVFVKDTHTGRISLVSRDSAGVLGNKVSNYPNLSSNGEYLVFMSFSNNLVSGDTNGGYDVFLTENPLFIAPTAYKGDVNNNRVIDLADVLLILKTLVGDSAGLSPDARYADTDGDGKISSQEVLSILQRTSGLRLP
jgi:hypothetical protein